MIIANRRRGKDYWEGYAERLVSEANEWVSYYRSLGQIAKVFTGMAEFRADCNKRLDKRETTRVV